MLQIIKIVFSGALIGVANTIPGVSGGTMAVILNIYDKILDAFSIKNLKSNLSFLLFLFVGGGLGIIIFSKAIVFLLGAYPMIINFTFIGLIIGSVPIVYRHAASTKVNKLNYVFFILALAIMITITLLEQGGMANKTLAQFGGMSLGLGTWLFFATLISTVAMLLPGISGSLLLLLFGVYTVVIESIDSMNLLVLAPVGLGGVLGLVLGVKVIRELINKFPQPIYFGILGLMVGSIFPIWPGFAFSFEGILSIACAVAFGLLAFFFSREK